MPLFRTFRLRPKLCGVSEKSTFQLSSSFPAEAIMPIEKAASQALEVLADYHLEKALNSSVNSKLSYA